MSKPELKTIASGVYQLIWEDYHLTAHVNRMRSSHDVVSAEVLIKSTSPGLQASHLHQARLNLTSPAARKTLAKHLQDEYADLAPWSVVVEQLAILTLSQYRVGEPILALSDLPPLERLLYRIEPFLLEKEPTLIYGQGGTGKSLLAAFFAVMLDYVVDGYGMVTEPGRTLYLDYESGPYDLKERLDAIRRGLGITSGMNTLYRFCFQPLVADIEEIQAVVAENEIDLVIVDSVGPACAGEPENAQVVLDYFRALRSLRVTPLSIDHVAKDKTVPFGSVYKTNAARSVWEIKSAKEENQAELHIGLFHRKVNRGRTHQPRGFRVRFKADGEIIFSREDIRDVADLAHGASLNSRVLHLLRNGSKTRDAIAEELEITEKQVVHILSYHAGKGIVTKVGEDGWGLAAKP